MIRNLVLVVDRTANSFPALCAIRNDLSFLPMYGRTGLMLPGTHNEYRRTIHNVRDLMYERPLAASDRIKYKEAIMGYYRSVNNDEYHTTIIIIGSGTTYRGESQYLMREICSIRRRRDNTVWPIALPGANREVFTEAAFHCHVNPLHLPQLSDAVFAIKAILAHEREQLHQFVDGIEDDMTRCRQNFVDDIANRPRLYTSNPILSPSLYQFVKVKETQLAKEFLSQELVCPSTNRMYYQLLESKKVDNDATVIVRHKITGDVSNGSEARRIAGIPFGTTGTLRPRSIRDYDTFVLGVNPRRKLHTGTRFAYRSN